MKRLHLGFNWKAIICQGNVTILISKSSGIRLKIPFQWDAIGIFWPETCEKVALHRV